MARRKLAEGLLKQVDQYLTSNEIEGLDTRAKHFYPSSASTTHEGKVIGKCLRAAAFSYYATGPSNPLKPEAFYTFELGHLIEDMYVDIFKKMGIFVTRHAKFYNPDFHISGELDIVLREAPGSKVIYGCEIKSSHGPYYKTSVITGRPGVIPSPKDDHLLQVMIYLDSFPRLPYFRIVYLGRDDFARTEYTIRLVEIDGDRYPEITGADEVPRVDRRLSMARIYNRYKDLASHIKKGSLPPRDYNPLMTLEDVQAGVASGEISKAKADKFKKGETLTTEWHCTYCDMKDLCRGIEAGPIERFVERYKSGELKEYEHS